MEGITNASIMLWLLRYGQGDCGCGRGGTGDASYGDRVGSRRCTGCGSIAGIAATTAASQRTAGESDEQEQHSEESQTAAPRREAKEEHASQSCASGVPG